MFTKILKHSSILILLLINTTTNAQSIFKFRNLSNTDTVANSLFKIKNKREVSNKGKFFIHWGYNFSSYTKSDINFSGPGYDFTLLKVKAADRPTKFSTTYINPAEITIPQFNFHFGYFFKDNYSLSLGWDHMKYVVGTPQKVIFKGHADKKVSNPLVSSGVFGEVNDGDEVMLMPYDEETGEGLKFEHTDGYNFAALGLERYDDIWVSSSKKQSLNLEAGAELGLLIPRSDVRLFGQGKNHFWNIAGYGGAAKVGLQYHFLKWMYVQGSYKVGNTQLNNIITTGRKGVDKAKQNIWFFENYWLIGFTI